MKTSRLPGFTAISSLYYSNRNYIMRSPALQKDCDSAVMPQLRGGGGGLISNHCVDRLQDCYIDCSINYPDDPLMQQGCLDSCDAAYNLCRIFGGGLGGVVAL
jgi:hypothetical protein